MSDETYLGDGLYASFDGFQIKLRASRPGPPERDENGYVNVVYLEPAVWQCLEALVSQWFRPEWYEERTRARAREGEAKG